MKTFLTEAIEDDGTVSDGPDIQAESLEEAEAIAEVLLSSVTVIEEEE